MRILVVMLPLDVSVYLWYGREVPMDRRSEWELDMDMRVTVERLRPGERERFLFCPGCWAETSADRADYFWMPTGQAFQCANGHRAVNVRLMTKHTVYELVRV